MWPSRMLLVSRDDGFLLPYALMGSVAELSRRYGSYRCSRSILCPFSAFIDSDTRSDVVKRDSLA